MKKEPKINPDLVIHTKLIMIKEHKDKPEKTKKPKNVYCKNCEHHWFDFSSNIREGYSPRTLHFCKKNVVSGYDAIGDKISNRGEDCFVKNANLNCNDFEQKHHWYNFLKK